MTSGRRRVITFGTFDLFHVGHVRILERAASMGDELVVGVSTDALNYSKKQRYPIIPQSERLEIVKSLKCVAEAFYEESLELKGDYVRQYKADCLVMGDDWQGKFDHLADLCEVKYLPRTESISTTYLEQFIRSRQPGSRRGAL